MKTKLLIPKKTKAQLINELEELQKRLAEAEIAEMQDGGNDNGFLKSFHNLVENLPVSILIHCEGKCVYLNRSAVGVLGGKSAEDFKGKSIWDFIHPDYRDLAQKRLDSVYSKGEWAHLVEEKFIRIDGKIIDVEIGGSAIDYAGKPATQIVFRDITKRDERERQIRYLADLVENVSDAVISTDMDFKILSWNKAAEDLYGWTRHEVKGKTVKDVTRIEYPANNQEDVLREFSRTGFWKGEVIQKRKDGTPLTIHASVSLVRDRAGKPAGAVAINRDITERKQAEEALRESEDRFRTLLETAYDGAGIHENGRLIEVNQALASMLGYEPSEMIGMEAFQFVVPESWQLVKESIQSEFDKPYEVVAVRKDGSTFPIEIIGKSCRYQGRQVRVSAVRDITARKESVETLRRERDFTKSLIDTAQTIILSLDTEGRIIHFNPYMEEVTGYRFEDVQGKDWCTTFIPKRDQKRIRNLFLKAASGIQTRGNINSILTKEGHEREIEWYDKTLKDADGTVIGMLSVGQDITERKQAERALQESEEKWRSLAENSPDHIILLDKDAKIIFINHTVPDLTKEQVIGTSVYTYVPSESVPIMKACFKRILKTGQSDHYEIDYITSEGETRNFETRVAPVMHDGEVVGFIENSTDVTEKKRAVQALQDSEERLKILFENLTIGIYRSTPEGQLLEANPAMLKLLGYPSFEELAKRNLEEEGFEPAYPRSQFKEIIERDGEVLGLESAWKKCDGSTIYVRENARAVRGEDGKTLYYEGTAEDITERKVNEKNLEFERKQLLSIFDGLNEAVNVNDPETHTILYANSYLRKIFGRDLVGEICHKVFHNSDIPCESCGYSNALENSGEAYKWEFHDNASKRDLAVTSQAIRWPDGRDVHLELAVDITERKQMEQALRDFAKKRKELEHIINQSPAIAFLWKAAEGWPAEYVSDNIQQFGYSPEDICSGRIPFASMVHPDDLERIAAEVMEYSKDNNRASFTQDYRILTQNGDIRWIDDRTWIRRNDKGEITHYQGIILDVTERKQAEQALRESETRFRTSLENMLDGFAIFKAVKDETGQIIDFEYEYINEAGCRLNEGTRQEFIGRRLLERWPNHAATGLFDRYCHLVETGNPMKEDALIYEDVWGSRLEQRVLDIRATKLGDGFAVAWRDVGEREKIESDLRESERRFREFADLLPQVVYETNSDGNLIYANRYAFEIFGYSQDDFDTGLQVLQMIIPEERDRARENTHRIFNGEISRGNEYTALRKDGSTFPIIIYATPISREGKPVGTRGIIIDITERKQVEEALRESEDKFRTLSEESFDGIIVHDNGRILEANRMFAKTWGYEPSEVIGMQTEDFITPESIETAKKAILSGSKKPYEAVARKKDGSLFPVEVIGKTILYKGKNVRISTARDITERKQVEKVLRESEERVRSILENSPDFIFIVDPDEKIQYMNRTIPNLTVEETVRKNVLEFIDPQYHDVNIRSVRHVFQTGESCAIESRSPDIKGNLGWYETRFGPIRSGGQVVAVMGTATDITKRKESEQELKKFKTISDKAEYGSAIADLEGNLLYINESFARIHGYSLHELIGGNLSVLHNDEQMKRFVKLNKHLLEKGSYVGKEVWHTRKDGTSFPALMTATVISNEKEEPSYIAATAIDITERKQAEEALKESEEKHRTYIENAPDAIFVTDSDGRYIEVNDAACRMTGYTREELLKMSIAELSPPDSPPEAFESFADLKRTGKSYGEIGIRRKDGTDIQASINAVTLTGERYMAFCSDITERKRAEEALRESEKRFKYLAELLPQTVFEIDVNGYLTFINDQGFKSYGITREDFERGFHALQLHVPDEHECMKEDIRRVLSGEDIGVVEYTGLRKDGSTFPVLIYSNAIYHNDKSVGIRGISIDITERKRVEEALRESEQKFKAIFEHAQDGILLADSESGKFLTGNPKICQMLGYSIDEIKNLRVEDIHPPEDLPYVRKQFARQLKKEIVVATNLPVQRKDGSVFFADVGSSPVTIEGKTYLAGIFRDITERKETEESLKESEQRFRELADLLPQIVFEVDAEGKFSFVNRHAVESTGYSQEEFYENLSPVQLTPPEHREITQKNFQRIFDGDKIVGEEQIIRRKDGTTFPIISYVNPVIRDGKVAGLRGMIVDITERKRSEEALLVSKTHLLNALRIAKLGNWEYDVAKDLFIFNDEFYTLFRTTAEEAGGYTMPSARYAEMFVHPEDRVVVGDEVRKAIESADPNYSRQVEHRIVYADGEIGYIAVRFQIVKDSEGRTVKTYGVNQDITERKLAEKEKERLETQLRQAQKMEAIGTLAGGIAHDFNNILAAMLGYTDMARKEIPKGNIARDDLEAVLKAGNRAKDLVKQILAFSRQTEHESQPIQIHPVVKEALKLLRASLPSTIEIREDINENCGAVMGDPTQIHQVLMNLCSNAQYAMKKKGGVLDVCLEAVDVDVEQARANPNLSEGPYVVLTVSDTGHGMDAGTLERIFEPFYTKKPVGEGTGMGLSTTHGIVRSCNGVIMVSSELGKGSTFRIYLPKLKGEASEKTSEEKIIPRGSETILFVDDEEMLVELGQKMLGNLGYNVTARTSSIEALEAFRAQPDRFDLVVTDQTMPNMTGAELATEVMHIRPDMPVILVTGFSEAVTPEKAKQLGIRDYIQKPVVMAELGTAIRQVLDESKKGD